MLGDKNGLVKETSPETIVPLDVNSYSNYIWSIFISEVK
jgi:hypothetical protein